MRIKSRNWSTATTPEPAMIPPSSPDSGLGFLDEPDFQSQVSEMEQNIETIKVEARAQEMDLAAAIQAHEANKPPPPPQLDPAIASQWDQFEKEYGVLRSGTGGGVLAGSAADLIERVVQLAAPLLTPTTTTPPRKPKLQWHYALDDETRGPVSEEELLKLVHEGTLGMTSFVWNKTMSEWCKFSETPLAEGIDIAPPPLPVAPAKKSKAKKEKHAACPACGAAVLTTDRFCPGCGHSLTA